MIILLKEDEAVSRPLRIEYEGAFCYLIARCNERRNIFFIESDYEKFKAYLKEAQEKHEMTNRQIGGLFGDKKMSYVNT